MDVASLTGKRQVPGGDSIEQMRDSMQAQFRLEARYIEPFLRDAGIQAVSHVFQFFNAAQRLRLLGADGLTFQDFDYDPGTMIPYSQPREDHWRAFSFEIAQGSLHGASNDRNKQVAIALFRMGAISRKHLLRTLDVGPLDQINAEIAEERATGMEAMPVGRTPRMTRGQRTGSAV